jgi:hypothetical protein
MQNVIEEIQAFEKREPNSPHLAGPNSPTKDRWWEDVETDSAQTALPLSHPLRG